MERVFYEPRQPSRRADQDTLEGEAIAMVQDAVDKLPRSLRDVIVLKEYGGLPYSEIAKTLGISEGNVKVRVHRARERLTNLLEGVDVQFRE
jgi:RNA polymerase sigma-70 factor (ECF subfamily)